MFFLCKKRLVHRSAYGFHHILALGHGFRVCKYRNLSIHLSYRPILPISLTDHQVEAGGNPFECVPPHPEGIDGEKDGHPSQNHRDDAERQTCSPVRCKTTNGHLWCYEQHCCTRYYVTSQIYRLARRTQLRVVAEPGVSSANYYTF